MESFGPLLVRQALAATGEALARRGRKSGVRLVVAGGTAGLLAGLLRASRTTADCDVLWDGNESTWKEVDAAAAEVARALRLPPAWLNRDCSIYAWCLPLWWQSRCEAVETFGPLEVVRLARFDLIASKVMGAPKRPQDLEDLRDIRPTGEELREVQAHLDRLESEHLDGATFEDQRAVVGALRGGL